MHCAFMHITYIHTYIFSPTMKVVNCQPHISPQNDEKRPVCNYNVLCWVYMQTYPALNTTLAVTTVAV